MNKIYSFLLIGALGASAASAAVPAANRVLAPRHSINALFGAESGSAKTDRTKSLGKLSARAQEALRPTAAPEGFEVITEAPEGTNITMTGESTSFYVDWGEVNMDEWAGLAYDAVQTADGDFYLKNPISFAGTNTYIKGHITEEGLSFDFPQPLVAQNNYGEWYYFYADILEYAEVEEDDDYVVTFVPAEKRTLTFARNDDGSYTMEEDYMLGLTCNDIWEGFGEMNLHLTEFNAEITEVPAGQTADNSYVLLDMLTGNDDQPMYRPLSLARDGQDVYIRGLYLVLPEAAVKGTVDEATGNITIPSNQLLGRYYNYYLFSMTGDGEIYYDDDWGCNMVSIDVTDDDLVLAYDAAKKVYTPVKEEGRDAYFIANFGNTYTCPCNYYGVTRIFNQGEITDFAPIAPEIESWEYVGEYDPMYSYMIEFFIYGDNNEGQMLMDRNIYYNLYINDELYPITIDEFPLMEFYTEEESITNIPVDYSDDDDIYAWGAYHGIVFRNKDIRKIGIQAIYILDGEVVGRSEITSVETASLSDAIAGAEVVATEIFDLTGRRVETPAAGQLIIKRQVRADGSVSVSKAIAQ